MAAIPPAPPSLAGEDLAEVVADRLLQLGEAARLRRAVGPPPRELRRVPEPGPLHVLVSDLEHPLGPPRHERQVLARVPPAGLRRPGIPDAFLLPGPPVPWVLLEAGHQRLQLGEQLPPPRHRERADYPHAGH